MTKSPGPLLVPAIVVGILLALLNVATISFYALWMNADQWAVNRSEAGGGFDPSQLPPFSGMTWLMAQGTIAALLAVDAAAILAAFLIVRSSVGRGSPSEVPAAGDLRG